MTATTTCKDCEAGRLHSETTCRLNHRTARHEAAVLERATVLLETGDCATYDEAVAQAEQEVRW